MIIEKSVDIGMQIKHYRTIGDYTKIPGRLMS